MPFSLQVKNNANSYRQGDVVAIRPDGFEYFEGDCLEKWIESGRTKESWAHPFAILYVTDENMDGSESEVQVLVERFSDDLNAPFNRKYYITLPSDENNPHRISIRNTGQSSVTWAEVQALIAEHS